MKRLVIAVCAMVMVLAVAGGPAVAGQKQAAQSVQVPPLTTEQIVMDCTISGVLFSAAAAVGVLKPVTVALTTMTTFALLHEAIYGCGIGVISGYVGQSLMAALPLPPPPNPFDGQTNAMLMNGSLRR
ncbi:MAG: hypothetical protein WCO00_10100 [Rhodospirillaceae bacterium]